MTHLTEFQSSSLSLAMYSSSSTSLAEPSEDSGCFRLCLAACPRPSKVHPSMAPSCLNGALTVMSLPEPVADCSRATYSA